MRLIDADKLVDALYDNEFATLCPLDEVSGVIDEAPTVDAVPVVRCRDCKKSGLTEFGKRYCSEPMGAFYGCIPVEDDFFCSGGRRKDDNHA